ncbi:helix-turn-helix transcriptional regulator [Streptomyces sp. A3M-1-3]|uniref:helix-turn-helix domain-containing protein n=1 Tax=Streptomyces sp. A3M-1-3 TaxID=2962044 RepID=UPI0020B65968|nr:helix-turn-helix transcriptional regulator [Streptomyces sp. A3M-1-3]MCP3819043.1 helix-turn-helix transcriptional regulator [Streptomyces sp. A3M-1-3]
MTETWRYCGNQVKLWRTQAGVSREELGKEAGYEYETVKSMEQGRRRPTVRLLQIADQMCGATGKLVAAQEFLKPEPFPARSQEFMAAEAEAIALNWYEPLLIPGLLQTEEYARALISESCPPLDDETVTERVSARLRRQEALTRRTSTVFGFVVYEAALRTMVGGRGVMRRQLLRLVEVGELRNVSIQVLPMGRCSGVALNGPLVLLETPDHEQWAWAEGQKTSALYAEPGKVSALTQAHGMIRMNALSIAESMEFIGKVAEEL